EADGVTGLVGTVNHAVERTGFVAEDALAETCLEIAMAAGGTEGVNGDQHARAGDVTVGNGVAKADVEVIGGTDIADGGEAGHESDTGVYAGIKGALRDGFLEAFQFFFIVVVGIREGEMGVGVDEAREKSCIAQIDDLGAGEDGRISADRHNAAAGDNDEAGSN